MERERVGEAHRCAAPTAFQQADAPFHHTKIYTDNLSGFNKTLEAGSGIEPLYEDLQSSA
jgi:hypothetical protein